MFNTVQSLYEKIQLYFTKWFLLCLLQRDENGLQVFSVNYTRIPFIRWFTWSWVEPFRRDSILISFFCKEKEGVFQEGDQQGSKILLGNTVSNNSLTCCLPSPLSQIYSRLQKYLFSKSRRLASERKPTFNIFKRKVSLIYGRFIPISLEQIHTWDQLPIKEQMPKPWCWFNNKENKLWTTMLSSILAQWEQAAKQWTLI